MVLLAKCVGQHFLLDVQGAVLALVVRQLNTNLSRDGFAEHHTRLKTTVFSRRGI